MSKHTPGPWKAEPPFGRQPYWTIWSQKESGALGSWVCTMKLGEAPDEEEPSARLIAAAPEMLEALKMAAPLLNNCDAFTSNEPRREAEAKINAAIAKAEGK